MGNPTTPIVIPGTPTPTPPYNTTNTGTPTNTPRPGLQSLHTSQQTMPLWNPATPQNWNQTTWQQNPLNQNWNNMPPAPQQQHHFQTNPQYGYTNNAQSFPPQQCQPTTWPNWNATIPIEHQQPPTHIQQIQSFPLKNTLEGVTTSIQTIQSTIPSILPTTQQSQPTQHHNQQPTQQTTQQPTQQTQNTTPDIPSKHVTTPPSQNLQVKYIRRMTRKCENFLGR